MGTKTVTLSATAWTLVSSSVSGTMENQYGQPVVYRANATLPGPEVISGLTLEREGSISWSFEPAQNIYARLRTASEGELVVVEG